MCDTSRRGQDKQIKRASPQDASLDQGFAGCWFVKCSAMLTTCSSSKARQGLNLNKQPVSTGPCKGFNGTCLDLHWTVSASLVTSKLRRFAQVPGFPSGRTQGPLGPLDPVPAAPRQRPNSRLWKCCQQYEYGLFVLVTWFKFPSNPADQAGQCRFGGLERRSSQTQLHSSESTEIALALLGFTFCGGGSFR